MQKINTDFNFSNFTNNESELKINSIFNEHKNKLSTNNFVIVFDTNILLRYHGLSLIDQKKLNTFLTENKERIILTNQISLEYKKNLRLVLNEKLKKIKSYEFTLDITKSEKIIEDFFYENSDILAFNSFFKKNINELKLELNYLKKKSNELKDRIIHIYKKLIKNSTINFTEETYKKIKNLDDTEIEFIKNEYDTLIKSLNTNKSNSKKDFFAKDPQNIFPGVADYIKKEKNSEGDFIIFHELLKLCNDLDEYVIFYTLDVAKGDWLNSKYEMYKHYILSIFTNTNNIFFIKNGHELLDKILNKTTTFNLDETVNYEINNFLKLMNIKGYELNKNVFIEITEDYLYPRKVIDEDKLSNLYIEITEDYEIKNTLFLEQLILKSIPDIIKIELNNYYLMDIYEAISYCLKKNFNT